MISVDVPYPDSVQALADALQADRVIVQETRGSGDASGADARLRELIGQAPFDVYVAVVDAPPEVDAGVDSSQYLATVLSRRIGEPGLYVVSADSAPLGLRLVGTGWNQTIFDLQVGVDSEAVADGSGDAVLAPTVAAEVAVRTAIAGEPDPDGVVPETVSLSDEVVDELVERERDLQPYERPDLDDDEAEPWTPGKRWMVGTTVGAGAVAVLVQSVWGWPGWRNRRLAIPALRRPRPAVAAPPLPPVPDIRAVRDEADAELTALAEALSRSPSGIHYDQAALAREVAEPLLRSDEVLDVVGALVLARAGRRETARAAGRARPALRVCFFDPRHPSGTQTIEWRYGDAEVEVPVCSACRRAIRAGRAPQALVVAHRGTVRPYYEGRTVWARTGFGSLTADLGELARLVAADRKRSR